MSDSVLPKAPFIVGQVFWRVNRTPVQITETCDLCKGSKTLMVLDASDESYIVECEACKSGYESTGRVTEWQNKPAVEVFVIGEVTAYRDGEWTIRASNCDSVMDFKYLHATFDEAWAEAERQCEALRESNWGQRKRRRENALQRAASSVAYHRRQIGELSRKLQWHRDKIGQTKGTPGAD